MCMHSFGKWASKTDYSCDRRILTCSSGTNSLVSPGLLFVSHYMASNSFQSSKRTLQPTARTSQNQKMVASLNHTVFQFFIRHRRVGSNASLISVNVDLHTSCTNEVSKDKKISATKISTLSWGATYSSQCLRSSTTPRKTFKRRGQKYRFHTHLNVNKLIKEYSSWYPSEDRWSIVKVSRKIFFWLTLISRI